MTAINNSSAVKRFFTLDSRKTDLEKRVSICLFFDEPIKNKSTLIEKIKRDQKALENATLSCFTVVIVKIVNFVVHIFSKDFDAYDRLLFLNKTAHILKARQLEIMDPSRLPKKSSALLALAENKFMPTCAKIGIYALEKFLIEVQKEELEDLKNILKNGNIEESHFTNLSASLKEAITERATKLGIPKDEIPSKIKEILETKYRNNISLAEELELHFNSEIHRMDKYQFDIKKNFASEGLGPNKERVSIDISFEDVTAECKNADLQKPVSIAMVGVEYAGFIKEGGLAEAVEGLSRGLVEYNKDNKVTLLFPKFNILPESILTNLVESEEHKTPSGKTYKVFSYKKDGVECKFIDHPSFTLPKGSNSIYGEKSGEYFKLFSEFSADLLYREVKPDIVHLHDWHVAPVAMQLKNDHIKEWEKGETPSVIFTFHNNNRVSQGRPSGSNYHYEKLIVDDYDGSEVDNLFVKALETADVVTTVSEKFASESQDIEYGEGVSFAVREAAKVGKLLGIINGTNPYRWNPETDGSLKSWKSVLTNDPLDLSFSPNDKDLADKKQACKQELKNWLDTYWTKIPGKKPLSIDPSKPFVTYIGRFDSYQKGLDKLEEAIVATLKNGGQFICMGMGEDPEATKILDYLEKKYTKGVLFIRDFRDEKQKLFYQQGSDERPGIGPLVRAASDFIFVPSKFEPCGLVQFEGWLFGSLAIGSNTGGLVDTIIPEEKDKENYNGYLFCRQEEMMDSCSTVIAKALTSFNTQTKEERSSLIKRLIETGREYGWTRSPRSISPVEKYLYTYNLAQQRLKVRQLGLKNLTVDNRLISRLKFYPSSGIDDLVVIEENYLHKYYNAKELDISPEELEKAYLAIPKKLRSQFPHPYGINFNHEKHLQLGSFHNENGTRFCVEAPNSKQVSLLLYNDDYEISEEKAMERREDGIWEINLKDIKPGQRYLYKIEEVAKVDPYAREIARSENEMYSVVSKSTHIWNDNEWLEKRALERSKEKPMSIYELHPSTWKKTDGSHMNYRQLAEDLVKHVKASGFTHVELMGILDHPDERSWGYQVTSFFSPNGRMGSLDDFKYLVDHLHQNGIGVILDWVPGHFAKDANGLSQFDGTNAFEHSSWNLRHLFSLRNLFFSYGSKNFDYSKDMVREFLISSANYWLSELHIDGLRVDCIQGILYSDDQTAAQKFLKELNGVVHKKTPGAFTIAEDYSGSHEVLKKIHEDGLGFDYKVNVEWKDFASNYLKMSKKRRHGYYDDVKKYLSEKHLAKEIAYVSHDETSSQGPFFFDIFKGMTPSEKTEHFKAFISLLTTSRGKKMMFSGTEIANEKFWNEWIGSSGSLMDDNGSLKEHQEQIMAMTSRLNELYRAEKALHEEKATTLEWIEDAEKRVHALRRKNLDDSLAVAHNFTDKEGSFKIEMPKKDGSYDPQIIFSSDDNLFGGQGRDLSYSSKEVEEDKVVYTFNLPSMTTIIIKES